MKDWITAHAKFIPPAVAAVAILFVDQNTVDVILAAVGAILTLIVPNDQQAINRVYHKEMPVTLDQEPPR